MEEAIKTYFNLSTVPGPNPPFCDDQLERILGSWTFGPHWMEVPGLAPSGPIEMEETGFGQ